MGEAKYIDAREIKLNDCTVIELHLDGAYGAYEYYVYNNDNRGVLDFVFGVDHRLSVERLWDLYLDGMFDMDGDYPDDYDDLE